jgi:hypothetical protein
MKFITYELSYSVKGLALMICSFKVFCLIIKKLKILVQKYFIDLFAGKNFVDHIRMKKAKALIVDFPIPIPHFDDDLL